MNILIRMENGDGCRLSRRGRTTVGQILRTAMAEIGIKGRYRLRSSAGTLNNRHSIARAGGKDPAWVERVWKLEPVAVRRKR